MYYGWPLTWGKFFCNTLHYKQHFCKQRQSEIGKKIKQMLSNTLRLNFWHLKIIGILHPRYHLTITGHILKNKQKNKHLCIYEIMQLIIMKMKTIMKIDSRKYGINRTRCKHRHKYSKYMKRLSMMMLVCIK